MEAEELWLDFTSADSAKDDHKAERDEAGEAYNPAQTNKIEFGGFLPWVYI